MPVVGVLETRAPGETASILAAFREGLKEVGYVEGHNVAIEYRMAEGQFGRLPLLAAELARRQTAVIFAATIPGALNNPDCLHRCWRSGSGGESQWVAWGYSGGRASRLPSPRNAVLAALRTQKPMRPPLVISVGLLEPPSWFSSAQQARMRDPQT